MLPFKDILPQTLKPGCGHGRNDLF